MVADFLGKRRGEDMVSANAEQMSRVEQPARKKHRPPAPVDLVPKNVQKHDSTRNNNRENNASPSSMRKTKQGMPVVWLSHGNHHRSVKRLHLSRHNLGQERCSLDSALTRQGLLSDTCTNQDEVRDNVGIFTRAQRASTPHVGRGHRSSGRTTGHDICKYISTPFSPPYPPRRPDASSGAQAEGAASHPPRSPCSDRDTEPTNTTANKQSDGGKCRTQQQCRRVAPQETLFCLHDYQILAARRKSRQGETGSQDQKRAQLFAHITGAADSNKFACLRLLIVLLEQPGNPEGFCTGSLELFCISPSRPPQFSRSITSSSEDTTDHAWV